MPELVNFQTINQPEILVVGKLTRSDFQGRMPDGRHLSDLWGDCFNTGVFATLEALVPHIHNPAYVGYMDGCDFAAGVMNYLCGMMMKPGVPVPDGFAAQKIAPAKIAVAWVKGPQDKVPELCAAAHGITLDAIRQNGLKPIDGWVMEVYTNERFNAPDANGDIIVDYYLPCE